jgi:hypothetical protein
MGFEIFTTKTFQEKILKQDTKFVSWSKRVFSQLAITPFVGKPLRVKWFREKKFENYRIYYIIFEEKKVVYVVNLSTKKNQQKIINSIWFLLDKYKKELELILTK